MVSANVFEKRMRIALYPGTFDPITLGHADIIARAARLVDELVVGVAENAGKNPLLSLQQRVDLVVAEVAPLQAAGHTIRVLPFNTLLMNFAQQLNARMIIRGLRAVSDFEYEFQMAGMNHHLNPHIETVFLMASETHHFIASRFVKEVSALGGDISQFVSPHVAAALAHLPRK
ncbi:MAG: pantetheine-phosphate adenylyltransferase [Alphaproteobacteria bacterium]|nr:pantetheine-phosphate adenylyltransferase [Alphaproteobacteria bacterium]